MVDPDARAIRVCRWPAAGQPGPVTDLAAAAGDALTSPLLPGFALEVAGLFAESARRG
jgi:hypothetical protein